MTAMRKVEHILVVDDDPVIRDMMVDILDLEGYVVEIARNGQEALTLLRNSPADARYLIFLDLMMPVMDGYAFCQALASDPAQRERHVIILMSAVDNLTRAAALGINATMPKPFVIEDVLHVIEPYMAVS
jgi:CheY-like chemotaxis protein